jgi:hypothetical protein
MALPWPILWLIDPAGAYWARRTPEQEGPTYVGGAVFGPDVPGGSRQATDEELEAMALWAAPEADGYERSVEDAERRWAPELREAADRLVAEGSAHLGFDDTDVDARLVRFWRGDSLLEIRYRRQGGEGRSRTRIPRDPPPELLGDYLARAVAEG